MVRLLTLTPNPAIDVTYRVERQLVGETVRVRTAARRAGGKGVNVARVLGALGRPVTAVAPLDASTSDTMRRELADDGVSLSAVEIAAPTRTTVAVVDDIAHPTLFAEPGPAHTTEDAVAVRRRVTEQVGVDDAIAIAGSFPPGTPASVVVELIDAAQSRGGRALIDTSGPLLLAAADAGAWIVKANAAEVREATGLDDLDEAARRLSRHGSLVVVSLGADGALAHEPGGSTHRRPAVPGVSGNPTGAGDAATAGLLVALTEGRTVETALAWASVTGAAAVAHPLAGAVDPAVVLSLAARVDLDIRGLTLPRIPVRSSP